MSEARAAESAISLDAPTGTWNNGSLHLWSLWDMAVAEISKALNVLSDIGDLRIAIAIRQKKVDLLAEPDTFILSFMSSLLSSTEAAADDLGLHATQKLAEHLASSLSAHRDCYRLDGDLQHLRQTLLSEAKAITFLSLPIQRREFYVGTDTGAAPFGNPVLDAFPSAAIEVREASNCYALERWQACVFHLMRVLEFGLTALAKRFGVSVDRSTWHQIIQATEGQIKKIDPTAGVDWKQQQKDFSDAATQFMFFKDAWRNHIMHVRDVYDEGRAMSIYQHTKEFMNKLAAIGLHETP